MPSDTYALICAKVPAILPNCAFQVSNPVQKANNFLVLHENSFDLADLTKESQEPQKSGTTLQTAAIGFPDPNSVLWE